MERMHFRIFIQIIFSGAANVSKNRGSWELLLPKASVSLAILYSLEKMIFSNHS